MGAGEDVNRIGVICLAVLAGGCSSGSSATVSPDAVASPSDVLVGSSGLTQETLGVMLPIVQEDLEARSLAVLGPLQRLRFERMAVCLEEAGFVQAAQVYRTTLADRVTAWGGRDVVQFFDLDAYLEENLDSGPPELFPQEPIMSSMLAYHTVYGIDPGLAETVIEVLSDCPVWTEEEGEVHEMHSALVADLAVFEGMWLRRLDEIDERADVKAVIDGIVPCLHESSPLFAEVTEPGLFLVDDRERPDEEVALMVRMAMECYRPLEEIRRPLREALRDEYVDEHYAELLEWQERIVSVREAVEALN